MQTTPHRTAPGSVRTRDTLAKIGPPARGHRDGLHRISAHARLRSWVSGKPAGPAAAAGPGGALSAQFADGPLEGTTREVMAIEGRPPKTIDVDCGARTVRYCLANWEQSGHSASYGYLYDV